MTDPAARALPPLLTEKLIGFRRQVRAVKLAEGLLAAAIGLALSWILVFALDRLGETPAWLRGLLLLGGAAVPGIALPLFWHRWVWRQRRLEDVARLTRRRFPRLGDQLLGIVELARADDTAAGQRSQRLVQAAIAQAAEAVKDADLGEAIPRPRWRRRAVWAVSLAALAAALGALAPEAARNAALRWLAPWQDTERYTFARAETLPDTLVVPLAEPFSLPAALAPDTRWTPARASARIPGQLKLQAEIEDNAYPFAFPPQQADASLSVAVGDDRARLRLLPRSRPELTSLQARVRLPDYLQYGEEPVREIRGGAARLLDGAAVSWIGEASREMAWASVDGQPQPVREGKLVTAYLPVAGAAELRFEWRDTLGLTPLQPLTVRVQGIADEPPLVTARREGSDPVALDTEVLAFDLAVQDDFGVRRAGLAWRPAGADPAGAEGEIISLAGEPEALDLQGRATFSAAREGVAPQLIELRAWAEDYYPGRERSYSAPHLIRVLSATDHAQWLAAEFGKWLDAARESYEREQQLHQANLELRELSPEALNQPENRRRLARQAAEEQANAARLDALNASGRALVEAGTRNPEFDAERLESWAAMLESLEEIARERMPSVAELLQESSAAPAARPPGDPSAAPESPETTPDGAAPAGEAPGSPPEMAAGDAPSPGDASSPGQPPSDQAAGESPADSPALPDLADRESSFPGDQTDPDEDGAAPSPPGGAGRIGLPATQLAAAPGEEDAAPAAASPAQESLDRALDMQKELLAEFSKVADELAELLASLEASTFVKRLKAASQAQMEIASRLASDAMEAFGLEAGEVSGPPAVAAAEIADLSRSESETVAVIQSDLAAFAGRKPDPRFTGLLELMKQSEVAQELDDLGDSAESNLSGISLSAADFWADTLDRWAEELVAAAPASPPGGEGEGEEKDSLPPEIVLKVMQALRDEMDLRDQTRELENSRPALDERLYAERAAFLAASQRAIAEQVLGAADDIADLPGGREQFSDELQLLAMVAGAMHEARAILARPDTGPEAIAAETEAIELLLQSRRPPPGGGGGGGGDAGGGAGSPTARGAALSRLGPGSEAVARPEARAPGQATGRSGQEFPEEFRSGLDAYFNALEQEGGAQP